MAVEVTTATLQDLILTKISADFSEPKPSTSLRFDVAVGETTFKYKVASTAPIELIQDILCSTHPTLGINVKKKIKFLPFFRRFATLQVSRDESGTFHASAKDPNSRVTLNLEFKTTEAKPLQDAVEAAKKKTETKSPVNDRLMNVRNLLGVIDTVCKSASDIHPAIGLALVAVNFLIEAYDHLEGNRKAGHTLAKKLDDFLSIEDEVNALGKEKKSRIAVEKMLRLITDIANYIKVNNTSGLVDILSSRDYEEKVGMFAEDFDAAMNLFRLSLEVEVAKSVGDLLSEKDTRTLDKLNPVMNSHYRAGEDDLCMLGTRVKLLDDTIGQLRDVDAPSKVLWTYGLAGSGKSSVANTVAKRIETEYKEDLEITCFFCKRDDPELSDPPRFFPSLAHSIGRRNASYRKALIDIMSKPEADGITTAHVQRQYELLFEEPLKKVEGPQRSHIIVIDALDECGAPVDQARLASSILSLEASATWIRVFITSRPEPKIKQVFSAVNSNCIRRNINDEAETTADIQHFIEKKFPSIPDLSLTSEEIEKLAEKAAGLFVWCNTLFKYIEKATNPRRSLEKFLIDAKTREPLEQLYALYDQVVDSAAEGRDELGVKVLYAILGTIYASANNRPLSAEALSCLLRTDPGFEDADCPSVQKLTWALHAVLYEDVGGAIRVSHPSLLDYVRKRLDGDQSKPKDDHQPQTSQSVNVKFALNLTQTHGLLFKGCVATLLSELKFNICRLSDSSLFNKAVLNLPELIKKFIPLALQYSARFFFDHLLKSKFSPSSEEVEVPVSQLLMTKKLFHWLEALSLMDAVGQATTALRACSQFFEGLPLAKVASDLQRFVLSHSDAMASAPHVYLSAMPFAPENTESHEIIAALTKHQPLITNVGKGWGAMRWTSHVTSPIKCVAYSPNRQYVAAGTVTEDYAVYILDAITGRIGVPLRGHHGCVRCLDFSSDNRWIASGSDDSTVRLWDVQKKTPIGKLEVSATELGIGEVFSVAFSKNSDLIASGSADGNVRIWSRKTGNLIKLLRGHNESVRSVAFCPNDRGKEKFVVSGSADKTIRKWDINEGCAVGQPSVAHDDWVMSVAVSPNGQFVASGSLDRTVRIWDAQTMATIGNPCRGHAGSIFSVAFSSDGSQIVSGSEDCTVKVWHVEEQRMIRELKGHSGVVESVAFSSSGRSIVSGSADETVRVWDVNRSWTTGEGSNQGHFGNVNAIALPPSGGFIVSGSDDAIVHMWDIRTGAEVREPLLGHTGSINSVAVSPNELLIATGSSDETLRIWNIQTGSMTGDPIQVHAGLIRSVAFSHDSQRVAFSSNDSTIRIIDVATGEKVCEPLRGHQKAVTSVAFYPGDQQIISGSLDGAIRVWSLRTGAAVGTPLVDDLGAIWAVIISPDGQLIASGAGDGTVRIRNAQTLEVVCDSHHESHVTSLAFSTDSKRLISCSWDCTVRVWDVLTGAQIGVPFDAAFPVNTVACSTDGQRIVSGTVRGSIQIWDARIGLAREDEASQSTVGEDGREATYEHWYACCSNVVKSDKEIEEDARWEKIDWGKLDGWAHDKDDKLILWIPHRYRWNFRRRLHMEISRYHTSAGILKPEVDIGKLYAIAGTGWEGICDIFDVNDSNSDTTDAE